ncbi:MAG TPA: peptide chain release factor N(5)-glutamine methyltransferase [Bryobacterales bacterium]|nr:peptide chain release factor N(5)-glutamine methyltransferase [Bryobacterales bacterium]
MNVATALRQGTDLLEKESISAPRLTAEVLLAHALRCDRADLYAHPERELSQVEQVHYGRYLHERLERKPTQYITGRQEFYGRMFHVTPAALIPRPETELVVEAALRYASAARRILDVGTGSGCLAVTLQKERPEAAVFACDLSKAALELAAENARRLDAAVQFFCADLLDAAGAVAFDLIVSNPPYVPAGEMPGLPAEVREHEPEMALRGGPDGVEFYQRLLDGAARVLRPGGWLIVELGYNSRPRVEPLVGAGWPELIFERDLAGFDRVMVAQRPALDDDGV